jgi:hypothetical protein
MYLKMMSNIYKTFEYLYDIKSDVNKKNYIKEKIAELIDDIIILINNDIISHDKNTYLFIIGYYLYIQLINYKKDKFIYEHCIYANSGKLFDDHFYQAVSDITNINQLQYIKFIIKILYIILPFLPSNIYINTTLINFIDILIKNSINNDIIFQKKCNYILSILDFLQIGIL